MAYFYQLVCGRKYSLKSKVSCTIDLVNLNFEVDCILDYLKCKFVFTLFEIKHVAIKYISNLP